MGREQFYNAICGMLDDVSELIAECKNVDWQDEETFLPTEERLLVTIDNKLRAIERIVEEVSRADLLH